jgi:outer membrane protein assembly factor BamD
MSIVQRLLKAKTLLVAVSLLALAVTGGCRHKKYENPITKETQQPDKVLFDKAIKDIEHGRYEVARLTLNTLMNTYDTSEYLAKAKLAIADSWMREGGTHAYAQAEAEYTDFILFYPQLEESAEAQMKICDIHFNQADKADRDPNHVQRADQECRKLLTQFPNSRFAPQAAQRVRQVQEVIAEGEFRVGAFYHNKGNYSAAANRLHAITEQYPLYSGTDLALWNEGDSYAKLGPRMRERSIQAYQKLVRQYPLSPYVEDAKKRLKAMEAEVPEPDPVALAHMKYELENQTRPGMFSRFWGMVSSRPDVTRAAKSGEPATTMLRPSIPPNVPIPGGAQSAASGSGSGASGGGGGVTDVTATTETGATTSSIDTKPDARLSQQGAKPAESGTAPAASAAKPEQTAASPATDSKPAKVKPGKRPKPPKVAKPSKPKKRKAVLPDESAPSGQPQDAAQANEQPKK